MTTNQLALIEGNVDGLKKAIRQYRQHEETCQASGNECIKCTQLEDDVNTRIETTAQTLDAYLKTLPMRLVQATNAVNHPEHYGGDTVYEAIKVIEAWQLDFNLGNAVKYICRAGKKNDTLEDLRKARWYLDREIKNLEKS